MRVTWGFRWTISACGRFWSSSFSGNSPGEIAMEGHQTNVKANPTIGIIIYASQVPKNTSKLRQVTLSKGPTHGNWQIKVLINSCSGSPFGLPHQPLAWSFNLSARFSAPANKVNRVTFPVLLMAIRGITPYTTPPYSLPHFWMCHAFCEKSCDHVVAHERTKWKKHWSVVRLATSPAASIITSSWRS